ncbi:MAG: type II toxin-antitoxin system RelE/ParE family toxin [Flavobacteriales bacterium]|nr:type II toxin-antitoxin system RelE/ParE family toxin [Flavobacteriales bacterium]
MPTLTISTEAENDLLEIWLYIAEDSLVNADRFLDRLYEKARQLAEFRQIGCDRPELGESIKSFPVDHYILFYQTIDNGIELIRVLNASRDIGLNF